MTPTVEDFCLVKSFACKSLRHPFTWVLGGVVFGALFMYALGKVSDIEKIVWFAAGTAITAVATVVQSYLSNKRAEDARNFAERIENIRQKHSENMDGKGPTFRHAMVLKNGIVNRFDYSGIFGGSG